MKINIKNGILDLESLKIEPHHPRFLFTQQINANFISKKQRLINKGKTGKELPTPYIDRVREEYPKAFRLLERQVQSIIRYDVNGELMVYLHGPTGSGKGTVLSLLEELFLSCKVSGCLHEFDQSLGILINQRIFFDPDMSISMLNSKSIRNIKIVTGKDTLRGTSINIKYVKKFQGKIRCFIICATNQFPRLPPKTDRLAWFRRCLILLFDKIQPSDPEFKENIIKDLDNWFTQLVLAPYDPIVTKNFDKRKWAEKQSKIWDYSANPFRRYVKEMFMKPDDLGELRQDEACDYIRDRMNDDDYDIPNEKTLKQYLTSEMSALKIHKKKSKYISFYYPCKLREEWRKYVNDKQTLDDVMKEHGKIINKYRNSKRGVIEPIIEWGRVILRYLNGLHYEEFESGDVEPIFIDHEWLDKDSIVNILAHLVEIDAIFFDKEFGNYKIKRKLVKK